MNINIHTLAAAVNLASDALASISKATDVETNALPTQTQLRRFIDAAQSVYTDGMIALRLRVESGTLPQYKAGDPDPTPNNEEGGPWCRAHHGGYVCTWLKGHDADTPHVAGTGSIIGAVWYTNAGEQE